MGSARLHYADSYDWMGIFQLWKPGSCAHVPENHVLRWRRTLCQYADHVSAAHQLDFPPAGLYHSHAGADETIPDILQEIQYSEHRAGIGPADAVHRISGIQQLQPVPVLQVLMVSPKSEAIGLADLMLAFPKSEAIGLECVV